MTLLIVSAILSQGCGDQSETNPQPYRTVREGPSWQPKFRTERNPEYWRRKLSKHAEAEKADSAAREKAFRESLQKNSTFDAQKLKSSSDSQFVEVMLQSKIALAEEMFERGMYDDAIEMCDGVIAIRRSPIAFLCRGSCYFKLKRYEESLANFEKLTQLEPENFEAWTLRGMVRHELKDFQGAISDYSEAIRLDPANEDVAAFYLNRGLAKYALKDYEGAISDYDRTIQLKPDDVAPIYYVLRGDAKHDFNDYHGAISDYDEAIRLDPEFHVAWSSRGNSKYYLKDFHGATADLDMAIRLDPSFDTYFNWRGKAKHQLKDYPGAISDYDESIRLNSMYVYPICNKSILLTTAFESTYRNGFEGAKLAERCIEIAPENGWAMNAKSCAYAIFKDFEKAIEWQKKAMQDPNG